MNTSLKYFLLTPLAMQTPPAETNRWGTEKSLVIQTQFIMK